MNIHNDIQKARFHLNMDRINGLVKLIFSDIDQLKPTGVQSDGVRADILRAIIVFLHATFEDVLLSQVPKSKKSLSFYSRTDIDKALKYSGIDAKPFRPLYPPLTQMAKRRKQIVHEADLSNHTNIIAEKWGITDDWLLIMWLMAVPAFHYQLRISTNTASVLEVTMYKKLRKAILSHSDIGNQLLSFPEVPPELRKIALEKIINDLRTIAATLRLDVNNFIIKES